jgi:phage-related protein
MRNYNQKIGLIGLVLGVVILGIGFVTHRAQLAGSLAMATIVVSALAAHYYPAGNGSDGTAETHREQSR